MEIMGKGGACVALVPRVWHFCDSDNYSVIKLFMLHLFGKVIVSLVAWTLQDEVQ